MAAINPQFIWFCSLNNTQESQFLLLELGTCIENCTLFFQHVRWTETVGMRLLRKWTITIWSLDSCNLRPRRIDLISSVDVRIGNARRFDENRRRINDLSGSLKLVLLNLAVAHCIILILLVNSDTTKFGPLTDWTMEPTITNINGSI